MACAACPLEPSEEKTHYLKWLMLLIDGGTMVLRHLFDTKVPPTTLATHLNKPAVKKQLLRLYMEKRITKTQKDLLYDPPLGLPDSSAFDITLLSCLLQNVCKLNQSSMVWSGIVQPNDVSTEADICRIRTVRNEVCHSNQTSMTEESFTSKYQELEQILLRLGQAIPDLEKKFDVFKSSYIDKECENALIAKSREWEELDRILQESINEIKGEQHVQSTTLTSLASELDDLKVDGQRASDERSKLKGRVDELDGNFDSIHNEVEQTQSEVQELANTTNDQAGMLRNISSRVRHTVDVQEELEVVTNRLTVEMNEVQTTQQKLEEELNREKAEKAERARIEQSMSSEMKNIASMSRQHIDDAINSQQLYFETHAHEKAKELLLRNNIIVISGHPGEGKTTMGLQLASEVSNPEKFLRIRDPSDWRRVDWSLGLFDIVLIDDIFGAGVMDNNLVKEWDRCLPDLQKMVETSAVKIIIATRHYILEDAKEVMKKQQLFKEEHVIQLASKDLTEIERAEILKKHMSKRRRQIEDPFIYACLELFDSFLQISGPSQTNEFEFGFPQCVEMFTSNDSLFYRGSAYFSRPNEFVRNCIEELRIDDEKFLALVMIWARQHKPLLLEELSLSSTSDELTRIARHFGFKLKPKLIKILRKSLKHHEGGFVDYNPRDGSYTFSHNVIGDTVGLVIGKHYPDETLEYISSEFLLAYLTTDDEKNTDYHFFIEERLFKALSQMLLKMLLNPHRPYIDENVQRLKSVGFCPNTILPTWQFDSSLVTCDAFGNERFVSCFLDVLCDDTNEEQLERFLKEPVMKMSGYFLGMGLKMTMTESITLSVYFLLNDHLVLMALVNRKMVNISQDELEVPMLIAVNRGDIDFVSFLLDKGVQPTEEAKYIAALNEDFEMLKFLMRRDNLTIGKKCTTLNGNSALTAASKHGLTDSVKCLIENGADLNHRNSKGKSALDLAIIFMNADLSVNDLIMVSSIDPAVFVRHVDICKVLIEAGADINVRSGKFKRTPLHVAADMSEDNVVKLLLQHGASTAVKDHRGHYPIHCAAIKGHTSVVKIFLEHDINLSKQRIISYGKSSKIKGMTVLHIAVWKEDKDMICALLDMDIDHNVTDIYGRTPFYCAVYEGKRDIAFGLLSSADVNKPEKQGFTPLHAALHRDHIEIAELLCLTFEADIHARDKYGRTPLQVACEKKSHKMINLLIPMHADVSSDTKKGKHLRRKIIPQQEKYWTSVIDGRCADEPPANEEVGED